MHGRGDNYTRQEEHDHEYNPTPVADESGRSVSSEGDIANHNPFNSIPDTLPPPGKKAQKSQKDRQDSKRPSVSDVPEAEQIQGRSSPSKKPKKTIIYSDKSESSIDEMMGDTPSNYNIPNGRLDGKSLGLKAILLHAKQHGNTIDPPTGNNLGVVGENNPLSPQVNSNSHFGHNGMLSNSRPGQYGPALGAAQGQDNERRFVSNLYN